MSLRSRTISMLCASKGIQRIIGIGGSNLLGILVQDFKKRTVCGHREVHFVHIGAILRIREMKG